MISGGISMDNQDYDYVGAKYNRLFAVLSYFGVLWILGLVIHPEADDPFVKNHVNNGIIFSIVQALLPFINLIPLLGWLIFILCELAILVFWFICVIIALTGSKFDLPVLSEKFQFVR